MIEYTSVKRIQEEYKKIIFQYKDKVSSNGFSDIDIRMLIEHVQLFWYKYDSLVKYILDKIKPADLVSFLAGAVRLDIKNSGAYEFGIVGRYHIVDDPFIKMATFFKVDDDYDTSINMKYIVKYFKDCLADVIELLESYGDDFWILPLNGVVEKTHQSFRQELLSNADNLILSMFESHYETVAELIESDMTFQELEAGLKPGAIDYLIYDSFKDRTLSLEERITNYLKGQNLLKELDGNDVEVFYKATFGNIMQILDIVHTSMTYNLIPFFRQDVSFNYFILMIMNLNGGIPQSFIREATIGFILQKTNFTLNEVDDYHTFKEKAMNHKLMDYMLEFVENSGTDVLKIGVQALVEYAEKFIG